MKVAVMAPRAVMGDVGMWGQRNNSYKAGRPQAAIIPKHGARVAADGDYGAIRSAARTRGSIFWVHAEKPPSDRHR